MTRNVCRLGLALAGGLLVAGGADGQVLGDLIDRWGDEEDEVLVSVVGAVRLDDGRVAVLDYGAASLFVFGGEEAEVWAGKGPGPGELEHPWWLGRCGEQLAVYDVGDNNIVHWDETEAAHESQPLTTGIGFAEVLACRDGSILTWTSRPSIARFGPGQVFRDSAALAWIGPERVDTLWRSLGSSFFMTRGGFAPAPLYPTAPGSAGGGWLYVGDSGTGVIQVSGEGQHHSLKFQAPERRVSRAAWQKAKEDAAAAAPTRSAEDVYTMVFRSIPRPKQYPAFGTIKAARTGEVWVERLPASDGERRWMVVSPLGEVKGSVSLPGQPLEIGADYVLLLREMADGVDTVELWSIREGSGSQDS